MKRFAAISWFLLTSTCLSGACRPDFAERDSRIDRDQVLAVLLEPPEAKPGDPVTTALVVASTSGPVTGAAASWAFCATPKLLTENGATSAACLADGVTPIADRAQTATAPLPAMGCFTFGPETESADLRPRDPDVTGGFFVPIRARVPDGADAPLTAFGFARITCNLANASADQVMIFAQQYHPNNNPKLLPLTATFTEGGGAVDFTAIPGGATVRLHASWTDADAESYALLDPTTHLVVTQRESMRVSWFATDGDFDHDRTGRTETELETFTDNAWSAPSDARSTALWVVLRDSRGGATALTTTLTTR